MPKAKDSRHTQGRRRREDEQIFGRALCGNETLCPGRAAAGQKYVKLNTNESPFPPSPAVLAALKGEEEKLNLYSDPTASVLVGAIAAHFDRIVKSKGGKGISEKQVFAGNGSDEVLAFVFQAFCGKGRGVATPSVGYGFYPVFCELLGIRYNPVPVKSDFSVGVRDYEGIKDNIVIANPNAQTGIYLPLSDIETLLSADKDRLVVVDEAYCDFGGESAVTLLDRYENLIVVQTMSKSRQLAGGRVGFALASEEITEDLNKMKYSFNPYNLNRLSIVAGAAAIADEEYFEKTSVAVANERERLKESLGKLGFSCTPSLANFVLAGHPAIGGRELYLALKEKGVLVRFLSDAALSPYVRITVGSAEQCDALIEAIKQVFKEKGI